MLFWVRRSNSYVRNYIDSWSYSCLRHGTNQANQNGDILLVATKYVILFARESGLSYGRANIKQKSVTNVGNINFSNREVVKCCLSWLFCNISSVLGFTTFYTLTFYIISPKWHFNNHWTLIAPFNQIGFIQTRIPMILSVRFVKCWNHPLRFQSSISPRAIDRFHDNNLSSVGAHLLAGRLLDLGETDGDLSLMVPDSFSPVINCRDQDTR